MKKISIIIFAVLICISFADAQIPPLPINGNLIGTDLGNREVQVKNLRTGDILTDFTSSSGDFLVEFANAPNKYAYGDSFEIKVVYCSEHSECVKTATYTGQSEIYTTFDLSSIPAPATCQAQAECSPCSCGGGGGVIYKATAELCAKDFPCAAVICPPEKVCPVPTQEECQSVVCPAQEECTVCEECEECEECQDCQSSINATYYIISGVIVVLFTIAGLVLGGYAWFPGLKGLSNYYIQQGLELMKQGKYDEAKKKIDQGLKTMQTAVTKAKEGEYK